MTNPACPVCSSPTKGIYQFKQSANVKKNVKEGRWIVECPKCGHLLLFPAPTDEELADIYNGHYYDAWGSDKKFEKVAAMKRQTAAAVLQQTQAKNQPGTKFLDCGAAYGFLLEEGLRLQWDCYGIEQIAESARRIEQLCGKGHCWSGKFEEATFDSDAETPKFDVITMCDFIEHARDPIATLKKAAQWLAPGGELIVTTPDGASLSRKWMKANWLHFKEEHLHYFSVQSLVGALAALGFQIRAVRPAIKHLSLDYLENQFSTYSPQWAGKLMRIARPFIPSAIWDKPTPFKFGEILVAATKSKD